MSTIRDLVIYPVAPIHPLGMDQGLGAVRGGGRRQRNVCGPDEHPPSALRHAHAGGINQPVPSVSKALAQLRDQVPVEVAGCAAFLLGIEVGQIVRLEISIRQALSVAPFGVTE